MVFWTARAGQQLPDHHLDFFLMCVVEIGAGRAAEKMDGRIIGPKKRRIIRTKAACPCPPNAGNQYYLVCTGSLISKGRKVPPRSLIKVQPGESAPALRAGPAGAEVLLLQFPTPSDRPGSRLRTLAEMQGVAYTNK